ncbi:MAG TPA: hypothetical protein PKN48_01340 [Bacteroidales bacterium]|nr:hypothetical protein [Bacteroidales bacterium]
MEDAIEVKTPGKNVFLYLLCTLSAISNVFSIIVTALFLIGGKAGSFLETIPVADVIAGELKHGSVFYYFIKIGIHLFCIFALILMAKKLRKGLLYYVLGQMFLLAVPWFFLLSLGVYYLMMISVISLIFALFFIILFAMALPKNVKDPEKIIS